MSKIDQTQVSEIQQQIKKSVADGKLWLAREHYSSLTRICGYDQSIYKDYADLLFAMREDLLAGKFYFLSGERCEESQRCIKLFMDRFRRKKLGSIVSQFPSAAQKMAVEDYPEPMRSELVSWGFSGSVKSPRNNNDGSPTLSCIFGIIALLLLGTIPIGVLTIIKWIIEILS